MDDFFALATDEQQGYFDEASAKLNLEAGSIEKDFWVCWILRDLFALPDHGQHLTFKGGTSLSKGWRLIQRFSEDIDIVIERGCLGIEPPDEPGVSGKDRERRLKKLKAACQEHVRQVLTANEPGNSAPGCTPGKSSSSTRATTNSPTSGR